MYYGRYFRTNDVETKYKLFMSSKCCTLRGK